MENIDVKFVGLDEPIEKIQDLVGDSFNVREEGNTWAITNEVGNERKWTKDSDWAFVLVPDGYMLQRKDIVLDFISSGHDGSFNAHCFFCEIEGKDPWAVFGFGEDQD